MIRINAENISIPKEINDWDGFVGIKGLNDGDYIIFCNHGEDDIGYWVTADISNDSSGYSSRGDIESIRSELVDEDNLVTAEEFNKLFIKEL